MRSNLLGVSTLRLPTRAAVLVLAVTALALAALLMDAKPAQASTFTVTKTADTNDGACDADCSLREAIVAANNAAGADTINVPAGTYTLAIPGRSEDAAASGDLDVTGELTITGAGAQSTTIDANRIDRVFEDQPNVRLTISGVTIKGGDPGNTFGGVLVDGGANLTLNDSIITGNKNASFGGGLLVFAGSATLNNVTISNNIANGAGGGIDNGRATLKITNSTINNNTATTFGGGGLQDEAGTVTLTNDTFSGNTASFGGSISSGGGLGRSTLTLTNVTINKNTINAGSGGGILVDGGSTAAFKDSIVANSTGGSACSATGPGGSGTITSQGNNLSSDGSCNFTQSTDKPDTNPNLGPLQNNGGPTNTHALLAGSPAIDAGSSTGCPSTDQRGVARPQDGDNNGSAICDIGAFELAAQGSPPPSPSPPPPSTTPPPPSSTPHPSRPRHHHGGHRHHHHGGHHH